MKEQIFKAAEKIFDIIPVNMIVQGLKVLLILGVLYALFVCIKRFLSGRDSGAETAYDDMDGYEFEEFCAELLKENGFNEVVVTKGSGDFGADILADKDGVTYAIQCKRYDRPVGVHAVLEIFAGKAYYDKMVAVVFTNQHFTNPAIDAATKLNVLLWDGDYLQSMMEER